MTTTLAIAEHLHILDYSLVMIYLAAMIGLGAIISRRIRVFKDYFLAGGLLTTPLLVCTLVSTYYELDVTFATSESGYYYGLVSWVWLSRPYYLAIILAALLLAGRVRRYGFMTLPDILEHHYGRRTRIVGALACFIYSLPITALAGMAVMFEALNAPPVLSLVLTVAICVTYTIMGGLWADAISDTIQFVLMCVSLAIAIPLALHWVGGFAFTDALPVDPDTGTQLHLTATGGLSGWLILAWTLGALTIFVEPAFYQRIFAARSTASVRGALLLGIALWAAYDWGVTLIGMIARSAVEQGLLADDLEGNKALLAVCLTALPVGLKGLFIGGILAAAMSSVDSYCLLASGNLVYDIYRPLSRRPMEDARLLRLTRIGVFAVMLIALALSLLFDRITDAWVFMASVLASAVFVPMMAALFWKPAPAAGFWSCTAGLAAMIAWYVAVYALGVYDEEAESIVLRLGRAELWREYAVIAALPVSILGLILGHIFSRRPSP